MQDELQKQVDELRAENERLTEYCGMFERGEIGSPVTTDKILALEKKKIELQKQVDELKKENARLDKNVKWFQEKIENGALVSEQAVKDTAQEIFEKIFEVLCCFTTQGKSKEYNKGFLDAVSEIDKRLQKLTKDKGVEVE